MRAVEPDIEGLIDRDGVKVGYAVYGTGPVTVVLAPAWMVVDARLWKAQVPYLSRYFRVITVDPRGNGRSDHPADPAAYAETAHADDLVAVMDAVGVERAVVAGVSMGSLRAVLAATRHPDRFAGVILIASYIPYLTGELTSVDQVGPDPVRETYTGWEKYNRHYWRQDWHGFLEFFFAQVITEPHSTKQIEDSVEWGLGTEPECVIAGADSPPAVRDRDEAERMIRAIAAPVLVIHGDADAICDYSIGVRLAELTGGQLITIGGGGHTPGGRHPVAVNRWMRDFIQQVSGPATPAPTVATRRWTRAQARRARRVLYLSSPIGLGHARRDLAIARRLRELHPDVEVDWLAQPPVTNFLDAQGERVHPASRLLASESTHWESEADHHDLHAFQALRRMDEILAANFMVFADLVEREDYDLWVGDEAWDVDFFLHENPELKRAPYAWLTDFVGLLPMPDGGAREAALTADYNAEMIEQIARFPRVRDRALFVGSAEDVVPDNFGPDLPAIREWTAAHYQFTGYVTGLDPAEIADRAALRAEFGWSDDDRVCLVTVGGTGVGEHLVRRAIAAFPQAAARVPGLRMVVATGPRIDPRTLPEMPGLQTLPYVPDLHRRLAACDVAVVQGGLTTTMELAAAGRPFIYVPLRHHFEQNLHVPHRLARYGAGRRLDYEDTTPDKLAQAIADEVGRPVSYRPVESDGADLAARSLAELL